MLDIDKKNVYATEFGNSRLRIFDRKSSDRQVIDIKILPNIVKVFDNFLIVTDSSMLYVLEKKTYCIIATF